ncbi:MAG TPA: hypothetical protein VNC50_02510, partial [Planctomycetia bacterium]|nr:hypothetical protein [Planctomycetia bacterium]
MTDIQSSTSAAEELPAKSAAYAGPVYPRIFASVETMIRETGLTIEEFCARRDGVYLTYAPDRPPTDRFLAAVHNFAVAELQLEYWSELQLANKERCTDAAYGRLERAAN